MGASGDQQPASTSTSTADETCGECGHTDDTVRDLGLKIRYALCDPCFEDLVTVRTVAGPLPLSRVLDDVLVGTDPPAAGRRSDAWRRTAPAEPEPGTREDRTA
jgi:hypothetical protein